MNNILILLNINIFSSHDLPTAQPVDPIIETTRGMSRKLSEIQFQIGNSPAKTTQNHYTQVTRRSTEVSIDMERNSVPNSRSWNKV